MNDQELLDELNDRIQAHYYANGYLVRMSGWAAVHSRAYETVTDGELVGVEPVQTVDFFPIGEFRCGSCYEIRDATVRRPAYFHYYDNCMICDRCNTRLAPYADPPYPRMSCRLAGAPTFDDGAGASVTTVHRALRPRTELRMFKRAVSRARTVAALAGKHFVAGMCTMDIWRGFLAQRVIRAFRRLVARKLQAQVAFVLSERTQLGFAAAMDIAQQHI